MKKTSKRKNYKLAQAAFATMGGNIGTTTPILDPTTGLPTPTLGIVVDGRYAGGNLANYEVGQKVTQREVIGGVDRQGNALTASVGTGGIRSGMESSAYQDFLRKKAEYERTAPKNPDGTPRLPYRDYLDMGGGVGGTPITGGPDSGPPISSPPQTADEKAAEDRYRAEAEKIEAEERAKRKAEFDAREKARLDNERRIREDARQRRERSQQTRVQTRPSGGLRPTTLQPSGGLRPVTLQPSGGLRRTGLGDAAFMKNRYNGKLSKARKMLMA